MTARFPHADPPPRLLLLIMFGVVLLAGGGWVTKMQSLYGVQASEAARVWAGDVNDTRSHVYNTMG